MANGLNVDKLTGDLKKLKAEIADISKLMLDLIKHQNTLNKEIGQAKGLKQVNDKLNESKKTQNEIEKEAEKLAKKKNTLIAKQDESLRQLTKDTIKQQEANKALTQQIKAEGNAYKQLELRYKKAAENAKKLAAQYGVNSKQAKKAAQEALKLNNQLKDIDKSIGNSQRDVGNYGKAWQGVKDNFLNFVSISGAVIGGLKLIWSEIQRSQEFQNKWNQGLAGSKAGLDVLYGSLKQSIQGNGGFVDFNKRLRTSIDRAIELERQLQNLTVTQIGVSNKVNALRIAEELYQSVADDATKSIIKREEFGAKAFAAREKRTKLELDLSKALFENQKEQNKLTTDSGKMLTVEQLQQLVTLRMAYDNARGEQKKIELDYNRFKRELLEEEAHQELDFIFDVVDKRKTANEKLIANEQLTASARQSILNETDRLLNESLEEQVQVFERFTDANIDINKLLKLNNREAFLYAKGLGLSDALTSRLLESIRTKISYTKRIL
jgi:hypothetical protein